MPHRLRLSIILPTLGREASLRRTVEQLLDQLTPEMELIVVDQTDHHEPATEKILADQRVRLIKERQKSAAHARNVGLQHAKGEVLLFLDDDIEIPADFLAAHLKNYDDPEVGGVVGSIQTPNEPELDLPNPGYVTFYGRFRRNLMYGKRAPAVAGGSGNISVRRSAAQLIGGWDEGFIGNDKWGDVDFCFRLRAADYQLIYDPAARLTHLHELSGGARSSDGWERYYYEVYRNDTRFFWRHRHRLFLPVFLGGQLVKLTKISLRGSPTFPLPARRPTTPFKLLALLGKGLYDGIRDP